MESEKSFTGERSILYEEKEELISQSIISGAFAGVFNSRAFFASDGN